MAGNPHCVPEGLPLPAGALPVPAINVNTVTITNPPSGLRRGTVVLLHGLGQTYTAWATTGEFAALATALQADGWQTIAIPYPADTSNAATSNAQNAALNTDFAGDPNSVPGTRYLNRFLAEWDHIKAYLVSVNGAYWPTWVVGFSLGGWSALQLFINRQADFVGMAALCPVTQMSYVYNPLSAAYTPTFAALVPSNVAAAAGGDVPITALNGITKPVWLGWGEGVEVTTITGWKGIGTAATAGETFDGVTETYDIPSFLGGPNCPTLVAAGAQPGGAPKLAPDKIYVSGWPWEMADFANIQLYHSGGVNDAVQVAGDQTAAAIAAAGYISVYRAQLSNFGAASGFVSADVGVSPRTTVPVSSYTGPDLVNGDEFMVYAEAAAHPFQWVTVSGNQNAATIVSNGFITVNSWTPTRHFGPADGGFADTIRVVSSYASGDLVVPDIGQAVGTPFAGTPECTIVDTTNWTGQPFPALQAGGAGIISYGSSAAIPAAATILRPYAVSGCQIWVGGDLFVGWARAKKLAQTAAANLGAGGSITTAGGVLNSTTATGYVNQNHVMTAGNVSDMTAWVTAQLDSVYAKVY